MKNKMWNYIEEQVSVLNTILDQEKELLKSIPQSFFEIEEIIIAASGSSLNAAMLASSLTEQLSIIRVTVENPFQLRYHSSLLKNKTRKKLLIVLSQTGKSVGTLECVSLAKAHQIPVLALTADATSPIAQQADTHLLVLCGEEPVGPKTKGFSATVLTLHLLLMYLTKDQRHSLIIDEYQKSIQDLPKNISDTKTWCKKHEDWAKAKVISIVGFGINHATAREGSLKLLETMQIPVMNFEMEEFMHGPHRTIVSNSYVIMVDAHGHGEELMDHLITFTGSKTDHYLIISHRQEENDHTICVEEYPLTHSWLNLVIPFQVMCTYFPEVNGVNSSEPIYGDFATTVGTRMV